MSRREPSPEVLAAMLRVRLTVAGRMAPPRCVLDTLTQAALAAWASRLE